MPSTFRLDIEDLIGQRLYLESVVLTSAVRSRRSKTREELDVQRIGQVLFEALFSREIYGAYRASRAAASQSGQRLRLVLQLGAPELAALPWEMLFDPENETYLCRTEPLVRRISAPVLHDSTLQVEPPLRVLGIVADPADLPSLNGPTERRNLERALAPKIAAGRIELVWAERATWEGVHQALLDGPWHVIHFIGHGEFNVQADEGHLILLDEQGNSDAIEANRLADLFSAAYPTPRLVVLNSCSSGESGVGDLFSSTATALVRGGIHAVIAMQFAISDGAAIAFAHGFYSALATGRNVDEAARNGRIAIRGAARGTLEWITPVLYIPRGSTQLFSVPPSSDVAEDLNTVMQREDEGVSPIQVATTSADAKRLNAIYVQAIAELRVKNYAAALPFLNEVLSIDPNYRDAQALHSEAARISRPLEIFSRAMSAETDGDFAAAIRLYESLIEVSPDFPEALNRLTWCRTMQQVDDLREEMRVHASAGRWQAVLEAASELEALNPAASDPDGLGARSRLELLWNDAEAAEAVGDLGKASRCYSTILDEDPEFRAAGERAEAIHQELMLRSNLLEWRSKMEEDAASSRWQTILDTHDELYRAGLLSDETGGWAQTRPRLDDLLGRAHDELLRLQQPGDKDNSVFHHPEENVAEDSTGGSPDSPSEIHDQWGVAAAEKPRLRTAGEPHARVGSTVSIPMFRAQRTANWVLRDRIRMACFSPDGTKLVVSHDYPGTLAELFDVKTGRSIQRMRGYGGCRSMSFSPDSELVLFNETFSATVFSVATGKRRFKFKTGLIRSLNFTPDGDGIITLESSYQLKTWSFANARCTQKQRVRNSYVRGAAFSRDGHRLATVDSDGLSKLIDVETLEIVGHMPRGGSEETPVIAISPDGLRVALIDREGNLVVGPSPCTPIDRSAVLSIEGLNKADIKFLTFLPHNDLLAALSADRRISIWDANTGECRFTLADIDVDGMAFSPEGNAFALWEGESLTLWSWRL